MMYRMNLEDMPSYIKKGVLLSKHTTFRIGGAAEYFALVTSREELTGALAFARAHALPVHILGGGSNVLVSDTGVKGVVIKNALLGIEVRDDGGDVFLTCAAGVWWDDVVKMAVDAGWWGIENLSSIPGTIGALPIQNVGAYGQEASQVIFSVDAININTGNSTSFTNSDCEFLYRSSFFKSEEGKKFVVTAVTLKLSKLPNPRLSYRDLNEYLTENENPTLKEIRNAVIAIRSKKFPDLNVYGTAGSFFKNPIVSSDEQKRLSALFPGLPSHEEPGNTYKLSAAWLIDNVAHMRGYRVGDAGSYEGQALVLVNYGTARANDVDAFAKKIEQKVFLETRITLEREVIFLK